MQAPVNELLQPQDPLRPPLPTHTAAAGTNCNRSCWASNNLFGLKKTLFAICKAQVTVVQTNETQLGSGVSGAPQYGVCKT